MNGMVIFKLWLLEIFILFFNLFNVVWRELMFNFNYYSDSYLDLKGLYILKIKGKLIFI